MSVMAPRKTHYDATAPVGTPENPSHELFTIPNIITVCRIALTFVFLVMFVRGENRYVALGVYAVAACTDWVDGVLARMTQSVSWAGKVLDPIVDRALLATGVLGLALRGELPAWIAVFVLARDVYLAIGWYILHKKYRRRPVDVIYFGKVTTALLMSGFAIMLFGWPTMQGLGLVDVSWLPLLNHTAGCAGLLLIYPALITSTITACIYTYQAYNYRKESLEAGERL